jgi:hypothetical protein
MVELEETDLADGLTLKYKSGSVSNTLDIRVEIEGDVIHSDIVKEAAADNHHGETERGKFLNELEDKVKNSDDDATPDVVKALVREWFNDLQEDNTEVSKELRGDIADEVIEGTELPVEIHGASDNNTTYNVTLTFRGRTATVEFDADVMIPGSSPSALQSAFAHQFYAPEEVPEPDWEDIRAYWAENSEVTTVTDTTADTARANRVLEFLSDSIEPTTDKENTGNSPRTSVVEPDFEAGPVVWVQNRHFDDEIDSVASLDVKNQICKELRGADTLVKKSKPRWRPDTDGQDKFWAFRAEAVGVDADDFEEQDGEGGVEV